VEGVKSFSRVLVNASVSQIGQGSGQQNNRLLLTGKVHLALGIPLQVASGLAHGQNGLVHAINSASELRAIYKHTGGVENKNKVVIARFDVGKALSFFREWGSLEGQKMPRLM